jgi:hypothetical protein
VAHPVARSGSALAFRERSHPKDRAACRRALDAFIIRSQVEHAMKRAGEKMLPEDVHSFI